MNDLIQRVLELSREEALEAAGFVSDMIAPDADIGVKEKESLKPLTEQPFQNIHELEQLSRLLLLSAATSPEHEAAVRQAIGGAGKKNTILGGAEIVALSLVAVYALQVFLSKGRAATKKDIEFGQKDGQPYIKIHEEVEYSVSSKLVSVLQKYFGAS